jgi:hypothetical protein
MGAATRATTPPNGYQRLFQGTEKWEERLMRISRTRRLQVEALESKTLLTTHALAAPLGVTAMVGFATDQHQIPLDAGLSKNNPGPSQPITGKYGTTDPSLGSERVALPGRPDATGTSRTTGLITMGHARVGPIPSDPQGKPILDAVDRPQRGPAPLPAPFTLVFKGGASPFLNTARSGEISSTPLPSRGGPVSPGGQFVMSPGSNDHAWRPIL